VKGLEVNDSTTPPGLLPDALATCDGIYMLRSWRSSKGARIERIYAQETGKFIAYEPIS
jgi:hypothetical protein